MHSWTSDFQYVIVNHIYHSLYAKLFEIYVMNNSSNACLVFLILLRLLFFLR